MEDDIRKKFDKMCENFDLSEENMKKVWKKFDKMCENFDLSEENMKKAWETIDRLAYNAANQGEKIKDIEEKIVKIDTIDQILQGQDKMMQILLRVDQERLATNARMERFEETQKVHTQDIQQLKQVTSIA